jgi:hypothetical protein
MIHGMNLRVVALCVWHIKSPRPEKAGAIYELVCLLNS